MQFLVFFILLSNPSLANTSLTALDAGEGLSLLLQSGSKGFLIDTGPVSHTAQILKRAKGYGVTEITHLLLTHLHADHASGYFRVIEEFPNVSVVENCQLRADQEVKNFDPLTRWIATALKKYPKSICARQGYKLFWEGTEINVLWPQHPKGSDLNHHSAVFTIKHQQDVILVMGDADLAAEAELLKANLLPKEVSVLVAGHHGANDASGEAFLKHVQPKLTIIPVDKSNFFERPAKATLESLKRYSKEVRLTGDGDIRLALSGVKENQNRK